MLKLGVVCCKGYRITWRDSRHRSHGTLLRSRHGTRHITVRSGMERMEEELCKFWDSMRELDRHTQRGYTRFSPADQGDLALHAFLCNNCTTCRICCTPLTQRCFEGDSRLRRSSSAKPPPNMDPLPSGEPVRRVSPSIPQGWQ